MFIYFFSLLHRKSKEKRIALQQANFEKLVSTHQLVIDEQEVFDRYLLAIDRINGKFIYIDLHDKAEDEHIVDIHQIKGVKLINEENSIYEDKKGKSVLVEKLVTSLQLEIALKEGKVSELLTFFKYGDAAGEYLRLFERVTIWKDNLTALLKKTTGVKS